jgi:hypothetical protein
MILVIFGTDGAGAARTSISIFRRKCKRSSISEELSEREGKGTKRGEKQRRGAEKRAL